VDWRGLEFGGFATAMSGCQWELESESSKSCSESMFASQACRYFSLFRLGLVAKPQLELEQVVACHWEVLDVISTVWK
jgi:hypothetical protein